MDTENQELNELAVMVDESPIINAMERASVDSQITTARAYPRIISKVKQKMLSFATLDEETAQSCFYALPARRGGDGKPISGPSVRLAEIAVTCYGHIRAGSRVVANDGKTLTAQAFCFDMENNVHIAIEVKRRITTKAGLTFSEDMQVMTGNAACAIALRNAVFKVVPMALIKPVYEAAKAVAIGDSKTLGERRGTAIEYFKKMGVSQENIFKAIGVASMEDIQLSHIEVLFGYKNSIKDGDSTVDEIFGSVKTAAPVGDGAEKSAATAGLGSGAAPVKVGKPIDRLMLLVKEAGLEEEAVMAYLKQPSIALATALQIELLQLADSKLEAVITAWPSISKALKK